MKHEKNKRKEGEFFELRYSVQGTLTYKDKEKKLEKLIEKAKVKFL